MKGDFSRVPHERMHNFAGVLHQQGRVLLDADWNAQTAITTRWEDTAGRDIIGAGVAAVPADQPDGFKIVTAAHAGGTTDVQLTVKPGRAWADGLLVHLFGEPDPDSVAPVARIATYLQPPIQQPAFDTTTIAAGVRDAVVLEVWREEFNGFQRPDLLIEPALGGPDTTERVNTAFAFRLMRLGAGDTCENIGGRLKDDFSKKGKLKVSLQPSTAGAGDCPTPSGGGYTGFEHNLYRIEIANVDAGPPQFKWSQYGGGLVGRGHFDNPSKQVTIKADLQAITNSGLSSFYLEALELDAARGHWRVTYGAPATLSNDVLTLGAKVFGTFPANPAATDTTFFRLWNGIDLVTSFVNTPLPNNVGIILAFDAPATGNYVPGDYWTFPVRAGEIPNADVLIDTKPPHGIHYHRVSLGVLTWKNAQDVEVPIEDCRHKFHPLTRLGCCCSFRVGDGMHSWGDFDTIQAAVDNLPADGGEVCVLPGVYRENVRITRRRNITIKGCGSRSRVISPAVAGGGAAKPVFHVIESQGIRMLSLAIEADANGIGVLLEGRTLEVIQAAGDEALPVLNATLEGLSIRAARQSAIEARVCYFTTIRRCHIEINDVAAVSHAVFFIGEDGLIEDNDILVPNIRTRIDGVDVVSPLDAAAMGPAGAALGGLQIGGTSERVRILNNLIARGIGQGIVLGSLITITTDTEQPVPSRPPEPDPCFPCRPGDNSVPEPGDDTTRTSSEGDLYDIEIRGNRICNMGLDGIGVVAFFPLAAIDEFISVHGLLIHDNEIHHCLNRTLADIPDAMLKAMGYGGIALADVDRLIVRDNTIVDNGTDFRQPICGVYVLHGEGIEISRNRILNNGARPTDSTETSAGVKRGARGGIHIELAIAPVIPIRVALLNKVVPVQSGDPALTVHDNVVAAPFGRALTVTALGAVSVVDNALTSRGATLREQQSGQFVASTVMILNLGLSNEFYLQLLAFAILKNGHLKALGAARPGLDDAQLGRFLVNGNVLFAHNQCSLDAIETGLSLSLSSILILSLDDVGFHGNQCDANLLDDFIITQAIVVGLSVRVSDNRFKEGIFNAALSAITIGLFNTTTDNQSTHCLFIIGLPSLTVDHANVSLMMIINPRACCRLLTHSEECGRRQVSVAKQPPPDRIPFNPQ